jgi:hypothetical protein
VAREARARRARPYCPRGRDAKHNFHYTNVGCIGDTVGDIVFCVATLEPETPGLLRDTPGAPLEAEGLIHK